MGDAREISIGAKVRITHNASCDIAFEPHLRSERAQMDDMTGIVDNLRSGSETCFRVTITVTLGAPIIREGWFDSSELTLVDHDLIVPRIVCIKCPAVAEVHYFEKRDGMTIWASCHGEHRWFGYAPNPSEDLIFNKLNGSSVTAIANGIQSSCRGQGNNARTLIAQIKFLESAGSPLTPEQLAPMRGEIENVLEFWQTVLIIAERKLGSKS